MSDDTLRYYLIWADYDGVRTEEFDTKDGLEKWYTSFMEKDGSYGSYILAVYYGKEIELEPTEVKTTYRIKK